MLLLVVILLVSCESPSGRRAAIVRAQSINYSPKVVILDEVRTKENVVITLFRCNNAYYVSSSTGGIAPVNIQSLY